MSFRPCAGIALLDGGGRVLAGRRRSVAAGDPHGWQLPQGGVDAGEDAVAASLRELEEETGIARALARVERVAPRPVAYVVPEPLRPAHWRGRFEGQAITWVVARFLGADADVDVATPHPEFAEWRWAEPRALAASVIPWKRPAYEAALALIEDRPWPAPPPPS